MTELWRVIPQGTERPAGQIWVTREALDRAIEVWQQIAADKAQPTAMRRAAGRLLAGRIEIAASIMWVTVDD